MFTRRFRIFRLLGFNVYLDLSWFLIALLITWSLATAVFPIFYEDLATATYWWMGAAGALGLFLSILLHEFGHAVVARQYGVPIRGITLFIFGGVAEMDREPPNAKVEFLVAIAGPIVSVVIAAACYGASVFGKAQGWPIPPTGVLWYLGVINAVVVGFNMIPAFPLDGGRVLRSLLWYAKGSLRWATRVTSAIGSGFGIFLIILGVVSFVSGNIVGGVWQFLIGMFLRGAAQMSYQQVLIRRALEGEPVSRFMHTDVRTVDASLSIQRLVTDYIYQHHHKMYPVVSGDRLTGCITIADVKKIPREQWDSTQLGDVVSPCSEENTLPPDTDAMHALSVMNRKRVSRMMIVEQGQLLGVLTLKDLMKFLSLKLELEQENGGQLSPRALPPRAETRPVQEESSKSDSLPV